MDQYHYLILNLKTIQLWFDLMKKTSMTSVF